MAVYLNNGNGINEIRSALTLINGLQNNIIEYDNVINIINHELYYLLKHKSRYNNRNQANQANQANQENQPIPPSRDDVLCALINKLDGFNIKTQEVKKIINYLSYTSEEDMEYIWFIKNIEKGYNPTAVVIKDVIQNLKMNNIEYLYNKFPTKFKSYEIFTFKILYNNVFGNEENYNPVKSHEIFTKFKLTNDEIIKIMQNESYVKSYMNDIQPNKINNYICNIIKYKKQYIFKYTYEELYGLLNWIQLRNNIIPIFNVNDFDNNMEDDVNKLIRNDFKNIVNHLNSKQLTEIINIILMNTGSSGGISNIQLCLNFIIKYCTFDKFKKNNIGEILKLGTFARFPLTMLEHFYDDEKDLELVDMILTFNNNRANEQQMFDLLINKGFISCSNEELFSMALEKGNISLIKHFINKKFSITEEMILNNYSDKILDILLICSENGFYITEKCFPHIIYVIYINSYCFDSNIDKIKKISIYVNDTEEFEKHKKTMKDLYESYKNLEQNILSNYNNTIEYLKNNTVTKELVVLASSKRIRDYLINKLAEEREKSIKKVIVKKVVKKVVKKSSDS
jgi:hypothetical protein